MRLPATVRKAFRDTERLPPNLRRGRIAVNEPKNVALPPPERKSIRYDQQEKVYTCFQQNPANLFFKNSFLDPRGPSESTRQTRIAAAILHHGETMRIRRALPVIPYRLQIAQNMPVSRFQARFSKAPIFTNKCAKIEGMGNLDLGRIQAQTGETRRKQARTENGSQKGGYYNELSESESGSSPKAP
jgi:hypothetical protein